MPSLTPFSAVLGRKNARHLLRRSSFVYTKGLIDQMELLTPHLALDLLLQDQAVTVALPYDPLPTTNPDGYWTESENPPSYFTGHFRKAISVTGWWWYNALFAPNLKFKLSHFLSTRFTIEKLNGAGSSTEFYDHIRLLHFYAYGNYKTLAKKMTLDNSMLSYLNNTNNNKDAPNENYAREFLELFTIGKGAQIAPGNYTTYTENDIVEAAKVLTGFKQKPDRTEVDSDTNIPSGYASFTHHDTTTKTFSSAFNNTQISGASSAAAMFDELDDFVDMVFSQQNTARNICRKIYQYFVKSEITPEVETDIIEPLSVMLMSNNYEMLPVLRTLLESQHFYDVDDNDATDETIGAIIKSPLQQFLEVCSYLNATIPNPSTQPYEFYYWFWYSFAHQTYFLNANMLPFHPESVAGYTPYYQAPNYDKDWMTSATLIARYRLGESLLDGVNRISSNNFGIYTRIFISEVIKSGTIVSDPSDPTILTTELMNDLFAQEPDTDRINHFRDAFLLQDFEPYNWTNAWNSFLTTNNNSVVEPRLKLLLKNILRAPESQIF